MKKLLNTTRRRRPIFKFDLKMKLSILLLLVTFFSLKANDSYAQRTKITLNLHNISVGQLIDEIESTTEFQFVYKIEDVDVERTVSINVDKERIDDILNKIFLNSSTTFNLNDRRIYLLKKPRTPIANQEQAHEKVLKKQELIEGTVMDKDGNPLPGANVIEKGTTNGVTADFDGNFTIEVADENAVLVISYIGFATQEVALAGRTTLNIQLLESAAGLDEVVIVGYGQVRKKDLTGSVSSVAGDDLENLPASRLDQALQGRAAGVNVTSVNGAPGARTTIRIRGGNSISASNEPLYVLDGFVVGTDFDLNTINVNDVKSIEILKDATSISIYGSRGANGVILITTKSGSGLKVGSKPLVSVNFYSGLQNISNKVDVLDGPSLAAYHNETATFHGNPLPFPNIDEVTHTDWQDEISRTGIINNLDASLAGNSEYTNYYVSANYFNQEGVIKNSGLERVIFRTNMDTHVSDKLTLGAKVNFNRSRRENNKTSFFTVLKEALTAIPVYDENGGYTSEHPITFETFNNPIQIINEVTDYATITSIIGNIYAEYEIASGLKFRSSFGPDIRLAQDNNYTPGTIPSRFDTSQGGLARIDKSSYITLLNENTLSYFKDFDDEHHIDALLGFTWQTTESESSFSQGQGYSNDLLTFNNLGTGDPLRNEIGSNTVERSLVSWLGRMNYSFRDKYYFTAVGRVDGSSVFAENNKYAFFPSVAASWRLDREKFIENLDAFSTLKLRASYGTAGSQAISPYQTLSKLNVTNTLFGESEVIGFVKGAPPADIKWETTDQLDIGLEIGLFNNRLKIETDYYKKRTNDLLLGIGISPITGFSNQLSNFGSIENKGLELSISSVNIADENLTWSTDFTISGNRSKVLDIGDSPFLGGVNGRIEVGEPVGIFKGVEYLGTIKTQVQLDNPPADWFITGDADLGFPILRDTDESGGISVDDYVTIGNPEPVFFGGLNNTFKYKGLTLDVFLQYSYGNDIYWGQFAYRGFFGDFSSNVFPEIANRWTPDNPDSDIPRAGSFNTTISNVPSTKYIFDGSFLRLKSVRLAYDIDSDILGVNGLSVYVIGDNLAIWTKYKGYDPEVNTAGTNSVLRGQDSAAYPRNRGITLGLNVKF